MKKTIVLFAATLFTFGNFAKSQNITIDSSMCNQTVNTGTTVSMSSPVTCTSSSQTTTFVCSIDSNTCPNGWTTHFCGGMSMGMMTCDSTQMPPSMTMMSFSMGSMQSYNLGIKFYTNSTPGSGTVTLRIYEQGNPSNYTNINYKLSTQSATGIENISETTVKIFPSVTHDFINFESNILAPSVIIYDEIGNKMMEQKLHNGTLKASVSTFHAGIYFVKIQNGSKQVTKKFMKIN